MSRLFIASLMAGALALAACGQAVEKDADAAVPASQETTPAPPPTRRAAAQPPVTVPEGTTLEVKLDSPLNSASNHAGDSFTAELIEPVMVDGHVAIPAGSTLHGTVSAVTPAKRGAGKASMTLEFTRLDMPGGQSRDITASLSQQTASKKKRNAAIIGGGAAGGALLGRIIGKDTKGAVVGSIVGGAIGTGVVMSKEGEQVNLPSGMLLDVHLDQSIQVPHRA
jgi:hypothetical protein